MESQTPDQAGGRPILTIVSGRPGAGKSTLARRLAEALSCPMVSRDEIFEGIQRTVERGGEVPGEVPKVAFDTFFGTLSLLVSNHVTVVAEAAFQDLRWRIGIGPLLPRADVRIVHCVLDTDLARDRVVQRRKEEGRSDPDLGPDSAIVRPFEPVALPVPTLTVSTVNGYDPKLADIVAFLQV